jgi:hypothetical protein
MSFPRDRGYMNAGYFFWVERQASVVQEYNSFGRAVSYSKAFRLSTLKGFDEPGKIFIPPE